MEKKNITIKDYEDKKGKDSGFRYCRFQTDEMGWVSCVDKELIVTLKSFENKGTISVGIEIDDDKGYKTVKKYHGPADESNNEDTPQDKPQGKSKAKPEYDTTSMYVSYAKDLAVSMIETTSKDLDKDGFDKAMEQGISMILKAKTAFESKPKPIIDL